MLQDCVFLALQQLHPHLAICVDRAGECGPGLSHGVRRGDVQ